MSITRHVMDAVLPHVSTRQWVLTLPHALLDPGRQVRTRQDRCALRQAAIPLQRAILLWQQEKTALSPPPEAGQPGLPRRDVMTRCLHRGEGFVARTDCRRGRQSAHQGRGRVCATDLRAVPVQSRDSATRFEPECAHRRCPIDHRA
jgi:hypothetical protein